MQNTRKKKQKKTVSCKVSARAVEMKLIRKQKDELYHVGIWILATNAEEKMGLRKPAALKEEGEQRVEGSA